MWKKDVDTRPHTRMSITVYTRTQTQQLLCKMGLKDNQAKSGLSDLQVERHLDNHISTTFQ